MGLFGSCLWMILPLTTYRMNSPEWPREKKWRHLYTRKVKVRRAHQLGFEYPKITERERLDLESLNVLFVCSMNKWRSPRAEKIYKNHPLLNVRSAGTSSQAKHVLSVADIRWAELIILMEEKHREQVHAFFRKEMEFREIHVLGIEDKFEFMHPELVAELQQVIDPILIVDSPNKDV